MFGSVPFGILVSKVANYGDPRKMGSGNIGATNVLRLAGKKAALAVLLCDFFKGFVCVYLARVLFSNFPADVQNDICLSAGMASVIGHVFSVFIKFKGGKGVATVFGVTAAVNPVLFIAGVSIWVVVFFVSRYSSVSAIVSISAVSLISVVLNKSDVNNAVSLAIFILVIYTHRQNIRRILSGCEDRMW